MNTTTFLGIEYKCKNEIIHQDQFQDDMLTRHHCTIIPKVGTNICIDSRVYTVVEIDYTGTSAKWIKVKLEPCITLQKSIWGGLHHEQLNRPTKD